MKHTKKKPQKMDQDPGAKDSGWSANKNSNEIQRLKRHGSQPPQTLSRQLEGPQVQPKLEISEPDDRYEREAEQVAEQVVNRSDPGSPNETDEVSQLKTNPGKQPMYDRCKKRSHDGNSLDCTDCEDTIQSKETSEGHQETETTQANATIPPGSSGKQLSTTARSYMEPRFNADFSDVRVHTGPEADRRARSIHALAFTVGRDVVFRSGAYQPGTRTGKRLLAHELTHVVQQSNSTDRIFRACDPSLFQRKDLQPQFFPRQEEVMEVFSGNRIVRRGTFAPVFIGLVQQALVDLGYDLGAHGRRRDGVDRDFGPDTQEGIKQFQKDESLPITGALDQKTLRCLDRVRARNVVPEHQSGSFSEDQYQIEQEQTTDEPNVISFGRGESTLDARDEQKIVRYKKENSLTGVHLTGFISEDERMTYGPALAEQRVEAVERAFNSGPFSVLVLEKNTRPDASSGVLDYESRRIVEIIPAGGDSETLDCENVPSTQSLEGEEETIYQSSVDRAIQWINSALGKLTSGDAEGDQALRAFFGGTGHRGVITNNLQTWKRHLDNTVRLNNQIGTPCNSKCAVADAYNEGNGTSAQVTVCPSFFDDDIKSELKYNLTADQTRSLILFHEAGHGSSLDTEDVAYGHRRLIKFISSQWDLARKNTDSYTLLVLFLNNLISVSEIGSSDTMSGMTPSEKNEAKRGVAWLQKWLTWTEQQTGILHSLLHQAQLEGKALNAVNSSYGHIFDIFRTTFNLHHPPGDLIPTGRDLTTVAAVHDRLEQMFEATEQRLEIQKDPTSGGSMRWSSSGATGGPGRTLYLTDAYFNLSSDRDRVNRLLPLIIRATSRISTPMKPKYENYIRNFVSDFRDLP